MIVDNLASVARSAMYPVLFQLSPLSTLSGSAGSARSAGLITQLVEQRFGFLQRHRVEALGEPIVDRGKYSPSFLKAPL